MNITTSSASFLPASAAQPTDVLRRDNQLREFITQINHSETFNRERGLGSDSERTAQSSSYANQLAEARIEAGFPRIQERHGEHQHESRGEQEQRGQQQAERTTRDEDINKSSQSDTDNRYDVAMNVAEATSTRRLDDGSYDATGLSADFAGFSDRDPVFAARGDRIERFYQGSYRPNESFLLGVA